MRLYLDTSVIGALFDSEMPQRIEITRTLLNSIVDGRHTGVISNIVLEEVERSPREFKEKLLVEMKAVPFQVRHPPQSGWLDEWGCLKGSRPR